MLKVGIIGTGHGKNVHQKALSFIKDTQSVIYGSRIDLKNIIENICMNKIDFIIIASPTFLHLDYIEELTLKRVPFICEKPVGLNIEKLKEIKKRLSELNVVGCFGYQLRYDPWLVKVKKLIDQKVIGTILDVNICWNSKRTIKLNETSWKSNSKLGGGIVWNYLPHIIDYLGWIIEPKSCALENLTLLNNAEDDVMRQIHFSAKMNNISINMYVSNNGTNNLGHKILFKGCSGVIKLTWHYPYFTENSKLEVSVNKTKKIDVIKKSHKQFLRADNRVLPTFLMIKDFINLMRKTNSQNNLAKIDDAIFVHQNLVNINKMFED